MSLSKGETATQLAQALATDLNMQLTHRFIARVTPLKDGRAILSISFNLTGEERALPIERASERPSFRSEVARYGGNEPEADARFTHLRPYEFLIFGPLE